LGPSPPAGLVIRPRLEPGPRSFGRRGGPLAAVLNVGPRVGSVLLAPLQCKRKPAKAPLTKGGSGFAFGSALNVTLCGNRGVRSGHPDDPMVHPRLRGLAA